MLLGLPCTDSGSSLDVDLSGDRSPSPDCEARDLDLDSLSLGDLPEDEFQRLRAIYDDLCLAMTTAKDHESVLERRVKDVSALLKSDLNADPAVMRRRRQEHRTATELRTEAKQARKAQKHRLRELGTLLNLKLGVQAFNAKSSTRSVAHLVADMSLKRRERASTQRKPCAPRTFCASSSPLRFESAPQDACRIVDFGSI